MKKITTVVQFEKLLRDHDWNYAFSDDKRHYKAYKMMEERIIALTESKPLWKDLYLLYAEFYAPVTKMENQEFVSKRTKLMEDYLVSIGN